MGIVLIQSLTLLLAAIRREKKLSIHAKSNSEIAY